MLTIRDPRAAVLAKRLAEARRTTMTQVVVAALEQELRRDRETTPLATRIGTVAARAKSIAGPGARAVTKDEIDALSGQ